MRSANTAPSAGFVVAMDEAGNTGENLLDPVQSIYSLVGVRIGEAAAADLVARTMGRSPADELKFRFRKTAIGRAALLRLLADPLVRGSQVRACVVHKPWMVVAKMVDLLIEPRMLAMGAQERFYADGLHVAWTDALYQHAPAVLRERWDALHYAFVTMVRDYGDETVRAYLAALDEAKARGVGTDMEPLLGLMLDTRPELDENIDGFVDGLDPAPTCLFWQVHAWSEDGEDFAVVHDEAQVLLRWKEMLKTASGTDLPPTHLELGEIRLQLPLRMSGLTFARSVDDPRVQVADVLAGTARLFYASVCGLVNDDFADEVEARGLAPHIEHLVGPRLPREAANRLPRN